jgi:hypothetical protein
MSRKMDKVAELVSDARVIFKKDPIINKYTI